MPLRKYAPIAMGFVVGVVVGATVLRYTAHHATPEAEARKRALSVLDRPIHSSDIGDNRIVNAVKKIEPAVVNIDTVGKVHSEDGATSFYNNQEVRGKGSGVILTPDGYIVTNNHVIEGAKRIRVTMPAGKWYYAQLVGIDTQTDLAVLHVDAANLPVAEMGDSDRLQVGEWSIAVGNPLGLGSTTTVGVISALNRRNLQVEEGRDIEGAIQTDAAINRGNSGGALANINGQLVGINTAILSAGPGGGSIGLGFALPVNTVRRVVRDIIADGKSHVPPAQKPWLGIQWDTIRPEEAQDLQLPADRGVHIRSVLPDTPASYAGILADDIILAIDGKQIGDERDIIDAIQQTHVGDRCTIHLLRPATRAQMDISVAIGDRPPAYQ
jgi:serine protease Do